MPRESCLYLGPYVRWCFPADPDPFVEGGPAEYLGNATKLWETPLHWNLRSNFVLEVEIDGVRKVHLCCAPHEDRPGRPSRRLFMSWGINTAHYKPDGLDLDLLEVDRKKEIEWLRHAFRIELEEWAMRFGIVPTYHWGLLVWYEP